MGRIQVNGSLIMRLHDAALWKRAFIHIKSASKSITRTYV
jgi:hypothetical protein